MKILDAFLFYNELDLLKVRLEFLGPLVDHFIISEANIDFSGKKKEYILNEALISTLPFNEKIIYHRECIALNSPSWVWKKIKYIRKRKSYLWKIQDAQRNAILKKLLSFSDTDILIFGDLDEFPSEDAVNFAKSKLSYQDYISDYHPIYICNQKFYYYNVNHSAKEGDYFGTAITSIQHANLIKPHKIRSEKDRFPNIPNGGWHFSYFMQAADIERKIIAICEVENLNSFKEISQSEILKKMGSGRDLFNRNIPLSDAGKVLIPKKLLSILAKYLPDCI